MKKKRIDIYEGESLKIINIKGNTPGNAGENQEKADRNV